MPVISPEFLLKALKENSGHVVKSFNASLGLLSQRVDCNITAIADNKSSISKQADVVSDHARSLDSLAAKVKSLEWGDSTGMHFSLLKMLLSKFKCFCFDSCWLVWRPVF